MKNCFKDWSQSRRNTPNRAYHAVLTLMVLKLLLCLSSPNFPSRFCCFGFDINQLKLNFVVFNYENGLGITSLHNNQGRQRTIIAK